MLLVFIACYLVILAGVGAFLLAYSTPRVLPRYSTAVFLTGSVFALSSAAILPIDISSVLNTEHQTKYSNCLEKQQDCHRPFSYTDPAVLRVAWLLAYWNSFASTW
jgi:hypothetical protein